MRILFLSPRQCWPAHGGAKLREYHFLRTLSALGSVTYAHFTNTGFDPPNQADLPFVTKIVSVPKPKAYGIGQAIRGIAGRLPLPVLNYKSAEMLKSVESLVRDGSFDLAHMDSIHMCLYSSGIARKVVYSWHNIESEAMRRYSETVPSPLRRWYAAATARKLEKLERQILPGAFGHIVCSERERCELQRVAPAARIEVIENGVDCSYFCKPSEAERDSLVFVALMENVANALAAENFARSIWPGIRQKFPNLRLLLVGAEPLESVRRLANLPGVEVTGTVPDLRPYYGRAVAAIVPLLSGSGTRLKILEAMAARVPVISTPVGAEGLDAVPNQHLLIAEATESETWVEHVSRLFESHHDREQLTAAAFEFVRTRYDWQTIDLKLKSIYESWLQE